MLQLKDFTPGISSMGFSPVVRFSFFYLRLFLITRALGNSEYAIVRARVSHSTSTYEFG
jgi:hypothetical protein